MKASALHPLVLQTASNALSCTSLGLTIWFCSEMLLGHTAFHIGEDYRVKTQTTNNLAQGLLLMRQSPLIKKKEKRQEMTGRQTSE